MSQRTAMTAADRAALLERFRSARKQLPFRVAPGSTAPLAGILSKGDLAAFLFELAELLEDLEPLVDPLASYQRAERERLT